MTKLVDNADRLTDVLGSWPTFHDAEVIRLALDRDGIEGPTLEARILVFGRLGDVGSDDVSPSREPHVATLRFHGISRLDMGDFNQQNVLFELTLARSGTAADGRIPVEMSPSFGLSASFECSRCEVVEVSPYQESV